MGLYDALDAALGGYLPGGLTPSQVSTAETQSSLGTQLGTTGTTTTTSATSVRGKRITIVAAIQSNGSVVPISWTPGTPFLYRRDLQAYKRVVKASKQLPARRIYVQSKRKR